MTVYKPRSAWTSSGRGGAQLTGTKLVGIAWHWPGTSQDEIGVESEAATANRLRGYRNFHVGSRGWSDIGYNFAIDQAGRVWDLRGLGRVGAHAASTSNPDANHEWMGVLLILGDRERPSARMTQACQDFRTDVFLARWPGRTRDTGHGRAPGVPGAQTSCPGPFVATLIVDGVLTEDPDQEDDDMKADERQMLQDIHRQVGSPIESVDGNDWTVKYAVQRLWHQVHAQGGSVESVDGNTWSPSYAVQRLWHRLYDLPALVRTLAEAQDEGLDLDAMLARLDQHAEAASEERQAILALVAQVGSGEATAEDVVRLIGEKLAAPDA